MSDVTRAGTPRLVVAQVGHQLRMFWRVPVAMFFTLALPLIMLVLFNALFGDNQVDTGSGRWPVRQFYTGGLAAFAAVSATYTNLANMVPIRREELVLKRWRGTPLPPWILIAGWIGSAVIIAFVGAAIMITLGVVAYDLEIDAAKMPAAIVTFLVGVSAFAALGMGVASLIKKASAASAVANATILPLAFVSDVFIAIDDPPPVVELIGGIFPLKPFVNAFQDTFNPLVDAPAFDVGALALVAVWGIAGAVIAVRFFRWEPPAGASPTRRNRRAQPANA